MSDLLPGTGADDDDILNPRRADLRRDRDRLHDWLESRAREIVANRRPLAVALELPGIGPSSRAQPSTASSARLADPLERLAAFASDNSQPVPLRREAQTALAPPGSGRLFAK